MLVNINVLEKSDDKSSGSSVKEESRSPEVDTEIQMDITLEKNSSPPLSPKEYLPALQGCRSVEEFQCLNRLLEIKMFFFFINLLTIFRIEEGTYGVVYRAKEKQTDEIVALKRLKMEKEKEGFPITSLREISTLLKSQHPNIVTVREIVVGSNMDKIFIVMDYVEHDMKSLMETMRQKKQSFTAGTFMLLYILIKYIIKKNYNTNHLITL